MAGAIRFVGYSYTSVNHAVIYQLATVLINYISVGVLGCTMW